MKNYVAVLVLMFIGKFSIAQQKTSTEKSKDSIIKTEVVNVITSYAPKVTDAFKIKRKPIIKLSKDVEKKALDYSFVSVPVASTFIPKSGTLKGIKIAKKERLFDNYIAAGFGNNITPYFDAYFHKNTAFDSEYGLGLQYLSSSDPVKNTSLSSSFYNIGLDLFYGQEERYFNWKAGFKTYRNHYNWYGLPTNIDFKETTTNAIKEEQVYKLYKIHGGIEVPKSYIEHADITIDYFSDIFDSQEFSAKLNSQFSFELGRFGRNLEDFRVGFSLDFLGGKFQNNHRTTNLEHGFFTTSLNPSYRFYVAKLNVQLAAKASFSMDLKRSFNRFFFYPNVIMSYPLVNKLLNIYGGVSGDLHTNSYKSLSEKNPYISPTINVLQTNEVFNFFGGFKGIVKDHVNYNLKAGYSTEDNKALFGLNSSKSDGNSATTLGGLPYYGYEYGNSFNVIYDNVETLTFFGEIDYDAGRNITVGLNGEFNSYTLTKLKEAWNLPQIKASIFGKYTADKWYAGTNIYYVGNRKGILYNGTIPTSTNLKGYIDVNVNGGYHINNIFSAFVKVNNATNGTYQRFTNFNSQGIQVIGGIIWKFDSFF